MLHILWTSTRFSEMNDEHWVLNHFVPMLPINMIKCQKDVNERTLEELQDQLLKRTMRELKDRNNLAYCRTYKT